LTTPPSFPILAGQGWSVHKKPAFSTRVASHVSGREARTPLFSYPLYEFELTFDALDSGSHYPGLGSNSLQSLMGLFLQVQGQFGTFLYTDPTDNAVAAQAIGIGDGATTLFTLVRTLGGFTDPVGWATTLSNVYLNGVAQTSGVSLLAPNMLTLAIAPGAGVVITADFSYAFQCRFLDDQNDFENFASGLWTVQSLKFRSVKP
jgi:uncharacterized protein (TIGR02217 family)